MGITDGPDKMMKMSEFGFIDQILAYVVENKV